MLKKIINFSKKGDFKFVIYEKFSKFIGHIGISINKLIYQSRLEIVQPYEVWGLVRILINGAGKISIGKNLLAVSDRRRSMLTLFSPCNLNIIDDYVTFSNLDAGDSYNTLNSPFVIEISEDITLTSHQYFYSNSHILN